MANPRSVPGYDRLRRAALERDGWRCRACGRAGRLEIDHIIPIHRGGAVQDPENLQALCRSCHRRKTITDTGRIPIPPGWVALVDELR